MCNISDGVGLMAQGAREDDLETTFWNPQESLIGVSPGGETARMLGLTPGSPVQHDQRCKMDTFLIFFLMGIEPVR